MPAQWRCAGVVPRDIVLRAQPHLGQASPRRSACATGRDRSGRAVPGWRRSSSRVASHRGSGTPSARLSANRSSPVPADSAHRCRRMPGSGRRLLDQRDDARQRGFSASGLADDRERAAASIANETPPTACRCAGLRSGPRRISYTRVRSRASTTGTLIGAPPRCGSRRCAAPRGAAIRALVRPGGACMFSHDQCGRVWLLLSARFGRPVFGRRWGYRARQ